MGLRINQNIAAQNAYRNLSVTDGQMSKSLEKLSSGYRINRAADDAAGLSISEGLRSQVGGLKVAVRNAQDGISVVQTAEGALTEVHSILQRLRDLSVQAASGGSNDADAQAASNTEFTQLSKELDRIAGTTKFGSQSLLGGTYSGDFQVDWKDTTSTGGKFTVAITQGVSSTALGLGSVAINTTTGAQSAIATIDTAIKNVSTARADFGAVQNRLESRLNTLSTYQENLVSSESRIRDVDMADEMTKFTKLQILQQAGTSMLAQANQAPQNVLTLLR